MSLFDFDTQKAQEEAVKSTQEKREKVLKVAKAYARCFATDEGQVVLQDLTANFIYNNDTAFESQNINYEAAYRNGEAGLVKFIISKISQVERIQ